MNYHETMTNWVVQLGNGDDRAIEIMFNKYFNRLIFLAVQKMKGLNSVPRSGEDIAMSAIRSFCFGIRNNKLSFSTENELWGCLFKITTRKVCAERRRSCAARRGGNQMVVSGDQTDELNEEAIFNNVAGKEPSPELAMRMAENADELLGLFKEMPTRYTILSLKLAGVSNDEIAVAAEISLRSVFWHLNKIQSRWMFYKSMEYFVDNLFDCVSLVALGENIEWPENVVVAVVNKLLELQLKLTNNKNEQILLHQRLFHPKEFYERFQAQNLDVQALEKKIGQIQQSWFRHIRSDWCGSLELLVKELLPPAKKE